MVDKPCGMTTPPPTDEPELEIAPADQQEDEHDLITAGTQIRFDAAISSTDWTTETVISQLRKGNIFLDPEFQRRDAWTATRKSQYIESLMLGIPTPQIILAERKEKRGSYIVIDGKQRLLSLRQFSAMPNDNTFTPFKLKGLLVREDLNDLTYQDISSELFHNSASDFDNATIRTVVIKSWPSEEFLYEVFLRINSGSVQLSPQELRQALHPGPFTSALNTFALGSLAIRDMLGLKSPDFRMRDNELVLRYLAFRFFASTYNGNLKYFLDDTTSILNNHWAKFEPMVKDAFDDLERAIAATKEIFGRDAFKRWNGYYFETRINRAIFDVMSIYFSDHSTATRAIASKQDIIDAYKSVSATWQFSNAVSGTTKSMEAVHTRFTVWAEALSNALKITVNPAV